MKFTFAFKNGPKTSTPLSFGDEGTSHGDIAAFIERVNSFVNLAYSKGWSRNPDQFIARFVAFELPNNHGNLEILAKRDLNAYYWDISDNKVNIFLYKGEADKTYRRRKVIVTSQDSTHIRALDIEDDNKPKLFLRSRILADTLFSA